MSKQPLVTTSLFPSALSFSRHSPSASLEMILACEFTTALCGLHRWKWQWFLSASQGLDRLRSFIMPLKAEFAQHPCWNSGDKLRKTPLDPIAQEFLPCFGGPKFLLQL